MKHINFIVSLLTLVTFGTSYSPAQNANTVSQQAYLKASNTGAGDCFGCAVALSGDTLVVGALHEDSNAIGINGNQTNNNATDSGAVYVFVRSGTNWGQQAYLKASNTGPGDGFGWFVAISGDTIVVAAPFEDSNTTGVNGNQSNNNATDAGAVYVFVRRGTNWSQQAYLKPSNTGTSETRATTTFRSPARPISSYAAEPTGASRPISKPPTPTSWTTSARQWRCPATRLWSGHITSPATPPG